MKSRKNKRKRKNVVKDHETQSYNKYFMLAYNSELKIVVIFYNIATKKT
jgi:hypothetical protein